MSDLRVERCSGDALVPYIGELARLRIDVFRDFPYLYDGDLDYEMRYLKTYVDSQGAVIVVVLDGDRVVGAATGLPLSQETQEFQRPFVDLGHAPQRFFYCAESVLDRGYRGRGLGVRFFVEREAHARALGGFDYFCFCAVDRPSDHPLRPADYVPLDRFWLRRGYRREPSLRTTYVWKDIDQPEETAKSMTFWLKPVDGAAAC